MKPNQLILSYNNIKLMWLANLNFNILLELYLKVLNQNRLFHIQIIIKKSVI
jgi:hypothetical protein